MDIIDAGITFAASAISGVAGILLHKYISRAKPTINVTSLSFEGDVIQISDEIQNLSRKCNWSRSISKYLSYEELAKFEIEIAQISAALQQEKETVDKWLEHFNSDGVGPQFSRGQMLRSPIVEDASVFGGYFHGILKRREMPELPNHIEHLKTLEDILPLSVTENKYRIHCGNFGLSFEKKDFPKDMDQDLELLTLSLSKGDSRNILKLLGLFSSYAGAEVYNYGKLIQEVRMHLINSSKLSIKVWISNTGHSPIIIKPYFAAQLKFGEKSKPVVLENVSKTASNSEYPFVDIVRSPQFQKSSTSTNYVSIAPGKSIQVNLVSTGGLGEDSNEIAEFYELGGLKGKVFAHSETGRKIESKLMLFSKTISDTDRKELIRMASR